jgi:hypothetical protein
MEHTAIPFLARSSITKMQRYYNCKLQAVLFVETILMQSQLSKTEICLPFITYSKQDKGQQNTICDLTVSKKIRNES